MDSSWPTPFPTDLFGEVVEYNSDRKILGNVVFLDSESLGTGQYGEVYNVVMPAAQPMVAKVLFSFRDGAEQVCKELRVCSKLRHPNIAACLGAMQTRLWPLIFFERVDGRTLSAMARAADDENTTLDESVLQSVFSQVLKALHYMQTAKVVHGDLQETNVMVTHDGVVKLIDFGLAEELTSGKKAQVIRHRMYAHPPELNMAELGGIDYKLDIFFVGAMLYRVKVRRRPYGDFPNTNYLAQCQLVQRGVNKDGERYDQMSTDLQSFVDALTAYEADARPEASQALLLPWITGARDYQPPQLLSYEPEAASPKDMDPAILTRMADEMGSNRWKTAMDISRSKNSWQAIAYRSNVLRQPRQPSPPLSTSVENSRCRLVTSEPAASSPIIVIGGLSSTATREVEAAKEDTHGRCSCWRRCLFFFCVRY
eukprot:scpid83577/ scgid30519/ Serine/threonine-protein kinase DDB_G0283821